MCIISKPGSLRHLKIFLFAELMLLEWFLRKLKCPYTWIIYNALKELVKQLSAVKPAEATRELFLENNQWKLGAEHYYRRKFIA